MFSSVQSADSFQSTVFSRLSNESSSKKPDWVLAEGELELETEEEESVEIGQRPISVGDYLPYGPRLYYSVDLNLVRMKDIGEKHRILLLGVIGAFTPYCWNRHLFRVINKARYYEERGIDFICCIATNDAHTLVSWSEHLGCDDTIFMLSDPTKRFTVAMGMDTVIPWLDNTVRSKRYIIYAEDMEVKKMVKPPNDGPNIKYECEHALKRNFEDEEEEESDCESDSWI